MLKNLPAVHETLVPSLHWEDLLEEKMATHHSILAWRIPWTEEPGGLQSMGHKRVGHDFEQDNNSVSLGPTLPCLHLYRPNFQGRLHSEIYRGG